jgi:hypothetical protein
MIDECSEETNIDKKIDLLYRINSMLPRKLQLEIPSLLTDNYIYSILFKIEQKLYNATKQEVQAYQFR